MRASTVTERASAGRSRGAVMLLMPYTGFGQGKKSGRGTKEGADGSEGAGGEEVAAYGAKTQFGQARLCAV
ncbi:hypothetical protein B7463_g6492, partial [Scytalidium lignicola]